MPTTNAGIEARLARLRREVVEQAGRVRALVEASFEACFSSDVEAARRVPSADEEIDRVDVLIERESVGLLSDATKLGAALSEDQLRGVLTIVKVNNELERIADAGVAVAERVKPGSSCEPPETMRVLANSVVGILRDAAAAFDRMDSSLARVVLQSEDAVEAFKAAVLRDAEEMIAGGTLGVDAAFHMHEFASQCERMADHCTNIAEQIIYAATGAIVRHMGGTWHDVPGPV
jgi:phosphate transport system protein